MNNPGSWRPLCAGNKSLFSVQECTTCPVSCWYSSRVVSVISTSKYLAAALYLHTRLHRASECLCAQTAPRRHIHVRHSTAYYPGLRVTGAGRGMKGARKGDGKFDKKKKGEWNETRLARRRKEEREKARRRRRRPSRRLKEWLRSGCVFCKVHYLLAGVIFITL